MSFAPSNKRQYIELTRPIILCFDGLSNDFKTDRASNVRRVFEALERDMLDKQAIYYQPLAGAAYVPPEFPFSKAFQTASQAFDNATAWYAGRHVVDAYEFIADNYHGRDNKICILGYGRGAYIACCLAGMLHTVGVVSAKGSIKDAYAYYKNSNSSNEALEAAQKFKKTLSRTVKVDFLGVWETITKYGLGSRALPFTGHQQSVRVFRQAKAINETSPYHDMWDRPSAARRRTKSPSPEGVGITSILGGVDEPVTAEPEGEIQSISQVRSTSPGRTGIIRTFSNPEPIPEDFVAPAAQPVTQPSPPVEEPKRRGRRPSKRFSLRSSFDVSCDECNSPQSDQDHRIVWFAGDREAISIAQAEGHGPSNPSLLWMVRSLDDARLGIVWGDAAFENNPTLKAYMASKRPARDAPSVTPDLEGLLSNDLKSFNDPAPTTTPRNKIMRRPSRKDSDAGRTINEKTIWVHSSAVKMLGKPSMARLTDLPERIIYDENNQPVEIAIMPK